MAEHDEASRRHDAAALRPHRSGPVPRRSRPLGVLTVALGLVASVLAPLVLSPERFLSLMMLGAFVGSLGTMVARSVAAQPEPEGAESLHDALRAAAVGAILSVFAGAVVVALGGYGLAVVSSAGAAYVLLWVALGPRATRARATGLPTPPFRDCTTAELAVAWEVSGELLRSASSPLVSERLVTLRAEYLDELERRDPAIVHAWLAEDAAAGTDARRGPERPEQGEDQGPALH